MYCHLFRFILFFLVIHLLFSCASKSAIERPAVLTEKPAEPISFFQQLTVKSNEKTVFEDNGNFILIEGSKCLQQDNGAEAAVIVQRIEMPDYVDNGTVTLNGWDLRFLQHDREVHSMRADITRNKLVKNNAATFLVFEAQGKLNDQEQKDAFEFCVFYSAFGYRAATIDAMIYGDHDGIETVMMQSENKGAVAVLEYKGDKGTLKGNETMTTIPRGFDFQFSNSFECELRMVPCKWKDRVDHRLLQIAYNLSQTGSLPTLDGTPQWVAQTIFKANTTQSYHAKTRAALIHGHSVKLRADFLALNPRMEKNDPCRKNSEGVVRTQTYRITDLPYDYAIPLLTGWELVNDCEHQKVQRAGIWLHDIRFDAKRSTMEYSLSSILRDHDGAPGFSATHRVTILGLNRTPSPPQQVPLNILIREHE